jgi:hypothetical protein
MWSYVKAVEAAITSTEDRLRAEPGAKATAEDAKEWWWNLHYAILGLNFGISELDIASRAEKDATKKQEVLELLERAKTAEANARDVKEAKRHYKAV